MMRMGTSVVRVEHPVPDYASWKREAFDRDPLGREGSGVRRYRVLRADGDPTLVAIELEFDNGTQAEAFAVRLLEMWRQVADRFGWVDVPTARIYELTAVEEY